MDIHLFFFLFVLLDIRPFDILVDSGMDIQMVSVEPPEAFKVTVQHLRKGFKPSTSEDDVLFDLRCLIPQISHEEPHTISHTT